MPQKTSPWRRIAVTVSAMLVVLLLASSYRFVASRGYFASVEDKTPATCQTVNGISEVTVITPVIAHIDNGAFVATKRGELYLLSGGTTTKLSGISKRSHATALSLGWGPDRVGILQAVMARDAGGYYVASYRVTASLHPPSIGVIEIGRLTTNQLTDPADLVSIDGTRFYLVNKHSTHSAFGRWLDDAFLVPRASVLYFDGMKFITVAERLNATAAVALSPDGAHLYVAEELPRALASFSRNVFSGALDNAELFSLPAAPTKITVAPDGSLIVAAWPKRGAGAVYRVRPTDGVPQPAELLYASKSEEITAAAEVGGHLLIGSQKRLIDCKI